MINIKGGHVKGKRHGEWTFWNVDGRPFFRGAFKNGENNGEWIRSFPEGEMKIIYVNGVNQGKTLGGIIRLD
jgi:antitoxin component YwqK of YwqJK toxin-antitoxin module